MARSQKEILQRNKEAIALALSLKDTPTEQEKEILKQFQGWGGVKSLLFPIDIEWNTLANISKNDLSMETDVKEFYAFIKENFKETHHSVIENIKNAILTSFYTPKEIPATIFEKLYENNSEIHSFLDPSAGNGVYIEEFLKYFPNCERVIGIEKDPLTALVLSSIYKGNPNVTIYNKGFEEVSFNEKFDVIASNIPFGKIKVNYPQYDNEITDKIHNFFFYRSAELLEKGGFLSFITSSGVFNSKENGLIREKLADQGETLNLITLPNSTFEEAGTQVTAHLFNFIKNENNTDKSIVNVLQDDNNITLNNYIYKYFDISFLKEPNVGTNPYGEKEYNYQMPLQESILALSDRLYFPKLSISRDFSAEQEIYFVPNYPTNITINDIQTKSDEMRFVQIAIPSDFDDFRVVGAIKGIFKGEEKPICVISKTEDNYFFEYWINDKLFSVRFDDLQEKDIFKLNFKKFLDELSVFCEKYQIKIDIDFKRTAEGKGFNDFVNAYYKKPVLTTFYVEREDIKLSYHRNIQESDILFSENRKPAFVKSINNFEDGKTFYQLEEIGDLTEKEIVYMRQFFGVYHYFNEFSNSISETQYLENNYLLTDKQKLSQLKKIELNLEKLNKTYDNFVEEYGFFNQQKSTRLYKKYLEKYLPLLQALENKTSQAKNIQGDLFFPEYEKADIFSYQYAFSEQKNLSIKESLIKSLRDRKGIDLDYICSISSLSKEEVLKQWEYIVTFNPLKNNYELKETFLNGNLYKKIDEISSLPNSIERENALKLLHSALPEKIPYALIKKQIGSRWIPISIIREFVNEFYRSHFQIFSSDKTDSFLVGIDNSAKGMGYFEYKCVNGRYIRTEDIIKNAYDDIYPLITYSVELPNGSKEIKTDYEATAFCKREINRLQKGFDTFMINLPEKEQIELEDIYNRMFNNTTSLSFEGDLIDFSSMQLNQIGVPSMYPHQKEAIWKMLKNNGGLVDHEVGAGKTLTMIGLSHSLKELGVCKKPVIIGLKANINEVATTYKKVYPNAKILFASANDYKKENRELFLNKIKMNNWDCVIMSHEQFQNIPQDNSVELEIAQQELKDLEDNLYVAENLNISKKQLSSLQISKTNLEKNISELRQKLSKTKKDGVLSFSELGIDHIIVDESHQYKNLKFQTRHTRVAGIGNVNGSQMASNLLTAIRTIQKNTPTQEGGATFFSGTPISNSLTELYLLHKFLTPKQLEERRCINFDSWASNFAVKSIDFEINMINEVQAKERFRYFINVPDLAKMYSDMASVKFGGNFVDRPKKNEYLLENTQSPLQKRFYKKLANFLKDKNEANLGLEKPLNIDAEKSSVSILAMTLAFKASLDMRLINSKYPDDPNSKINTLVRDLLDKYHSFNEQKGTQIVFCDMSTSKKKLSFEELEDNYNNRVFTSIYDDIKYKLMKAGVPEKEIAFVQHYDSDKKKEDLSKKMNAGEIRFLIGGTQNAGTGLNIQTRLIRIAHLSIPWKPSEVIQRNGRGFRKGNWIAKEHNNNVVDISFSGTIQTLDNYKMNTIANKEKFINQIRTATNPNIREVDEGELDENTGMNIAEFQAQLSGDNTLLEKYKVERKIKDLEAEKTFVETQKAVNDRAKLECNKRNQELDTIISIIQQDFDKFQSNLKYDEKGTRINKPVFFGLNEDATDEEISTFLKEKFKEVSKMSENTPLKIGGLYGFDLCMQNRFMGAVAYATNPDNPKISYDSRSGLINFDKDSTAKNFYINCLSDIERRLNYNIKDKKENLEKLSELEQKILPIWDKEETLSNLYKEKEFLENKIRENSSSKEVLPSEEKIIDNIPYQIPVVKNIQTLDNALLKDLIGRKNKMNAIFTTSEVVPVLQKLETMGNIEIHTNYFDEQHNKEYVKFIIKDADALYCDLDNVIKNGYSIDNEKVNQNKIKL